MDWEAERGELWHGLRRLVDLRRATRAVHAAGRGEPFWTGNDHVFGLRREHAGERLLLLVNFTAQPQPVACSVARERGFELAGEGDFAVLEPYAFAWLT
jgi:amylosucrase